MKTLEFKRPTICEGIITFSKTEAENRSGDDVVVINTTDAGGGRGWWVGLNREQCREAIIYMAKCLRDGGDDD